MFDIGDRKGILTGGEGTSLEGLQTVEDDSQQDFVGDPVDAMLADGTILEQDGGVIRGLAIAFSERAGGIGPGVETGDLVKVGSSSLAGCIKHFDLDLIVGWIDDMVSHFTSHGLVPLFVEIKKGEE